MEASIQAVVRQTVEVDAELCGGSHVKGVLLADNRGLSVAVQGECKPRLAGKVAAITALAGQIEPDEDNPVILIESGVRKYLIKKEEKVNVLIVKDL